jgi:23S rRNA (guanosine2251-2'-O)-methyltransferase
MVMVVILNNIRSLYNVGSIFRTADGAGAEKLYLCGITPAPIDVFGKDRAQIAKVALGAQHSVPWEKVASASVLIKKLKIQGYRIFAVEQAKNSILYCALPKSYILSSSAEGGSSSGGKFCLVFGAEVTGLPSSIVKLCDKILEIPMRGMLVGEARHPRHDRGKNKRKESLNVSVAAGIVMYALSRYYVS